VEGLKGALGLNERNLFQIYDILIFVETFLIKNLDIQGYYSKHILGKILQENGKRVRRGVSIYYNAKAGRLLDYHELENTLILNFESFSLVASYICPTASVDDMGDEIIEALQYVNNISKTILTGDFNARLDKRSHKGDEMLEIAEWNSLELLNNPNISTYIAHNGESTIDLIFKGKHVKKIEFDVQEISVRKHKQVHLKFQVPNLNSLNSMDQTKIILEEDKLKNNYKCKYEKIFEEALTNKDLDSFYSNLLELVEVSKTTKLITKKTAKSWFDRECYMKKSALERYRKLKGCPYYFHESYCELKREYINLIKNKKLNFDLKREETIVKETEKLWYKVKLFIEKQVEVSHLPIDEVEDFFSLLYNANNSSRAKNEADFSMLLSKHTKESTFKNFISPELSLGITKMKNGKSPGIDGISNETLKMLEIIMLDDITRFFNICVQSKSLPENLRVSKLKLLFKNKGDKTDCNSYRGIAISNSLLNLLERVLYHRLFPQVAKAIPPNQYGFMPKKSTLQAITELQNHISDSLSKPRNPLYILFLDVKKAFDTCSRKVILENLIQTSDLSKEELEFFAFLLEENFLEIFDGVVKSSRISQTQGIKQGSTISPLLFNLSLSDINKILKEFPGVILISYADDMVLICYDLNLLKLALQKIITFLLTRNLKLNFDKCKIMKITRKGRGAKRKIVNPDVFKINGKEIEFVSKYSYLGIIFQSSGTSFMSHVEHRSTCAHLAIYDVKNLPCLSVLTGLKIFDLKIAPIVSYGIQNIWQYLTLSDFRRLEKVKGLFLRRLLNIAWNSRSNLTYCMIECPLLVEQLKQKFNLPETPAYNKFYEQRLCELSSIPDEFYNLDLFSNEEWKGPNFKSRHIYTRFAIHGFHGHMCKTKRFHANITDECICKLCELPCSRYHLKDCKKRTKTLTEYSKMKYYK
jgi:hypothetical protein